MVRAKIGEKIMFIIMAVVIGIIIAAGALGMYVAEICKNIADKD